MAHGNSGRIVIDVDPAYKKELYTALTGAGLTLKDWFLRESQAFCEEQRQPLLLKLSKSSSPSRPPSSSSS